MVLPDRQAQLEVALYHNKTTHALAAVIVVDIVAVDATSLVAWLKS
jgi:hypothetical protein